MNKIYFSLTFLLIFNITTSLAQNNIVQLKEKPIGEGSLSGLHRSVYSSNNVFESKEVSETNKVFDKHNDWIIYFGGAWGKDALLGDVGVMTGAAIENIGIVGYKAGTEFSLKDKFFIAPKVGIEFDYAFISAKASFINYTDFKHYEPKITPEIGLSALGFVNFTYGYNISLTSRRMENVPTHRLSLTINIPLSTHPAP